MASYPRDRLSVETHVLEIRRTAHARHTELQRRESRCRMMWGEDLPEMVKGWTLCKPELYLIYSTGIPISLFLAHALEDIDFTLIRTFEEILVQVMHGQGFSEVGKTEPQPDTGTRMWSLSNKMLHNSWPCHKIPEGCLFYDRMLQD